MDVIAEPFDVFISYAHQDELDDTEPARTIAGMLETAGYSVWWDASLYAGQDWPKTIQVKLRSARRVLALWSPRAAESFWCKHEWVTAAADSKLIPFVLESAPAPPELAAVLDPIQREPLNLSAADVAQRIIRAIDLKPSKSVLEADLGSGDRVDVSRLPAGPTRLIGRGEELELLKKAWLSCAPNQPTHAKSNVVVLHALGGAGKTALLREFLSELADDAFPNAAKVFGWSAYSQGSGENKSVSPEAMIADALEFFGGQRPTHNRAPVDRVQIARDLVARVRQQRALIVLDGIEPLQDLPHVHRGQLKHPDLRRLILDLAAENPGLLIVTSRQPIVELESTNEPRIIQRPLERLSTSAGVDLLMSLGVHGRRIDIESAVEEAQGHALSLTLLGTFLDAVEAGAISRRDQFGLRGIVDTTAELAGDDQTGRLAKRANAVMRGYVQVLKQLRDGSAGGGEPELAILSIVGLFDRPAEPEMVEALFSGPPIKGITGHFMAISPAMRRARWAWALKRLRALKLLNAANPSAPEQLDAHPLVRKFFGDRLRRELPRSCQEANFRLYEYCLRVAEDCPSTLRGMQPLFDAVAHGCAAGCEEECWREVYGRRINRGTEYYLTTTLGAYAADLATLTRFFGQPWLPQTSLLSDIENRRLFDMVGRRLEAIGRIDEALPLLESSYDIFSEQQRYGNASRSAGHLSEAFLSLGRIDDARHWAERAVFDAKNDASDQATRNLNSIMALSRLGEVLRVQGDFDAALQKFEEAVTLQRSMKGDKLASIAGYRHSMALLDVGRIQAAKELAHFGLQQENVRTKRRGVASSADAQKWHLPTALLLSVLCEVKLAQGKPDHAATLIDKVVSQFRAAGSERHLPLGLLLRARIRRQLFLYFGDSQQIILAQQDLDEVYEIVTEGRMLLHLADFHLVSAAIHTCQISPLLLTSDSRETAKLRTPWWRALLVRKRDNLGSPPPTMGPREERLSAALDLSTKARRSIDAAESLTQSIGYRSRAAEIRRLSIQLGDLELRTKALNGSVGGLPRSSDSAS